MLRMTRAGAAFKPYVDRALHDLDDGLAAVAALAIPRHGEGVPRLPAKSGDLAGTALGGRVPRGLSARALDLEPINDELVTARLEAPTDFEITTAPPKSADVQWRPLLVEPLAVVVPVGHPLGQSQRVHLREVSDEPFVMLRSTYSLRRTCDACPLGSGVRADRGARGG